MKRLTIMVAALAALFALASAGAAFAQGPVAEGYNPQVENGVLDEVDRIPPPQENVPDSDVKPFDDESREAGAPQASGGSLPFTGLDVGLLALGGIAMLGVGVGLRRMSRSTA